MIGVGGGLLAALLWGVSAVAAARSSRELGPHLAIVWVVLIGAVISVPIALAIGLQGDADTGTVVWTCAASLFGPISFYFMYAALEHGTVSVAMPIVAVSGGMAALISVALGERLAVLSSVGLVVLTLGLVALLAGPPAANVPAGRWAWSIAFAFASAATAGIALYGGAVAAGWIGTAGLVAAMRSVGVLVLGGPLLARGQFRLPGRIWPFVLFSGIADATALGAVVYAGARDGVAVPAVLSSQFAAVAAIVGIVHLGERLTRAQVAGVLAILAGIAAVSAAQG